MRSPRRLYSMVTLVIAGFALVVLPPVLAVVAGAVSLDRLASRSERLVQRGIGLVRASEALESELEQMERNARQYRIVGRDELARLYAERHRNLIRTLDALAAPGLDAGAAEPRRRLRASANAVAAAIANGQPDDESMAAALERFDDMQALAVEIEGTADAAIARELAGLERRTAETRAYLFWQTVALVPVTLALVGIFSWLILRPIGRLGRAIRGLGAVETTAPIAIGGPPEIRALGDELERLRVRLERSEAEKTRFLRHLSHDLKTPLASIREGTELIADGSVDAGTAAHDEVVEILRSSGMELQQLIENLLVLSARDLSREPEAIELAGLIDQVAGRHRLAIGRHGLRVSREISGSAFTGFRPLIQSALSNLVGNAVRFSPEGGNLYIRARLQGEELVLEVADEGPGIPAADRPYVFEPFFKGEQSPHGDVRGTGVGLSVVRDCARAHDGDVEIVDGEFAGAHFRLLLRAQYRPRPGALG